jgi:pyruvate ferredoxin oxidoreductase alpha subunit
MTAYYQDGEKPMMANYVVGLGGRDVSPAMVRDIYKSLLKNRKAGKVSRLMSYVGVRGE